METLTRIKKNAELYALDTIPPDRLGLYLESLGWKRVSSPGEAGGSTLAYENAEFPDRQMKFSREAECVPMEEVESIVDALAYMLGQPSYAIRWDVLVQNAGARLAARLEAERYSVE